MRDERERERERESEIYIERRSDGNMWVTCWEFEIIH